MTDLIDFRTHPDEYRHWKLTFHGRHAHLSMDVDPDRPILGDYELKLNSYDLGVDIELADAVQRLRFEHPEVGAVVIDSLKDRVFCSGANIRMLGKADHAHKVNFCKFTNETRNGIEEASAESHQVYLAAVGGTAAGGGYELALACQEIILVDDRSAAVSLPEVPLLAVLPGTGGLTRLTDKRLVRRDLADVFCTTEEGIRGQKAVDWGLVDVTVPTSRFDEFVEARAEELAGETDRPAEAGIVLTRIERTVEDDRIDYEWVSVEIDREAGIATLALRGPDAPPPPDVLDLAAAGDGYWALALGRQLDDALLHLRLNELSVGTLVFRTEGDPSLVAEHDRFLADSWWSHWLAREVVLFWRRLLKRLDVTSRTTLAFVTPGSCFVGFLADILFAVDRSYGLIGAFEDDERPAPTIRLTDLNFGPLIMPNGLTRLQTRFWGHDGVVEQLEEAVGVDLDAASALERGLLTDAMDEIDWDDEIRLVLEARAAFSADSLTGMEANLRFPGPETMETKIFGRLTAWQNWIFQRPSAAGEEGALKMYGSGLRPTYDPRRV